MINAQTGDTHNEFSHPVKVSELPKTGVDLVLEADDEERDELAKRYNILTLQSLNAKMRVVPWKGRGVHVNGGFAAHIEQACVVTLEPVEESVSGEFSIYFLPETEPVDLVDGEIVLDPENEDELDQLQGDELDVGEIVAEQLAVAINPYPRKPGVDASAYAPPPDTEDEDKPNPFAVLEQLKAKQKPADEKN